MLAKAEKTRYDDLITSKHNMYVNGMDLYSKTFGGNTGKTGKEMERMMKRVDKHLNEVSTKIKLLGKIREAL